MFCPSSLLSGGFLLLENVLEIPGARLKEDRAESQIAGRVAEGWEFNIERVSWPFVRFGMKNEWNVALK